MSIRPVQIAPPTSPPLPSARPAAEVPVAPTAAQQVGALPVPEPALAGSAAEIGTISADRSATARGIEGMKDTRRVNAEELAAAVDKAQQIANAQAQEFSFSVHEKTGEIVVKIIDRESKEVIRQIPAEEMLHLAERLQELDGKNKPGLLLKQEA